VIIWALVGIPMKKSENQSIVIIAEVSAIIIVAVLTASILITRLRRKLNKMQKKLKIRTV
jgi:hypothetical protein